MSTRVSNWAIAATCICALLVSSSIAQAGEKIKITKLDDLPQHVYPFDGKVSELVQSKADVMKLAALVRADIEADLEKYEINDALTLKSWHGTLLAIEMLEGNYDNAVKLIEKIRSLETKESAKLTTGLLGYSMIAAKKNAGNDITTPAFKKYFSKELKNRASKLPWNVVQDDIEGSKGMMEIYSKTLLIGMIQSRIDPVVAKLGELSASQAQQAIGMHYMLTQRLQLKDQVVAVYDDIIKANRVEKKDIWAERSVTLSANKKLNPVLLAVWDSGTDPEVFRESLWTNSGEKINGKDDDGNGFVDDVHGIAYDVNARPSTELLFPLGDSADEMPQILKHLKGFMDVQASIDSEEASALKRYLGGMNPADVGGFLENLGLAGNYTHGTHVAGLMMDGNPFASLLIARLSYDHRIIPVARTKEWVTRDAAKCRDTVAYFQKYGVRVVNMSWGEAQPHIEDSLEKNGIGDSAEERREIARANFAIQKAGLLDAIKGAPEILFVCAAGNADSDVEFEEDIPSSFDLPNVLVVGAVDQAGDPTSFTSFGKTVQVYGSGFEVDSYLPGGKRMKMSGTSMASPNVANLAGKLLAIDPSLTPAQVVSLIKKGADKKETGSTTILLANPKKTIALLKK